MIQEFPSFKKLELSDKSDIEAITNKYPPYSDFNFTSMWCWDTENKMQISKLHNNLVVRFTDYISGKPFYSFLGDDQTEDVAKTLIEFSKQQGLPQELKLIPEITVKQLNPDRFKILEDRDSFDYMYKINKLSVYDGNILRGKRNLVNRFIKNYTEEMKLLDLQSNKNKGDILNLFHMWVNHKKFTESETENELRAINNVFKIDDYKNFVNIGLYDKDKLIGFTINEILPDKQSILHFEKANDEYIGIYPFLMQASAKILLDKSVENLNYEQDLGIPGLRLGKKSYYPFCYLKKFYVSLNT